MPISDLKVSQETFNEFLASLKEAASIVPKYGTINVDPDIPGVIQIWYEIKGIIYNFNKCMKPFLKWFGVEKGNGLSTFSVNMDRPGELINDN